MNLIVINMFKRHFNEFFKKSQISDFKNAQKVEKIRMFDVFPSRKGPFDDTRS